MTLRDIARTDQAVYQSPTPQRRAPALLRAARIVHPFPTVLNAVATAGLAVLAVRGAPDASVLARMIIVMLCAQCAIGVANDYYDRELDAAAKPWKPIPSGLVSTQMACVMAIALIAATMAVGLTLGAASFGLAMVGLACGLAYDARLKRTVLSGVPFMVAIPTLPLWVWVTMDAWQPVCWWLLPLGGLIGLALHLANTLPDIEADAAHGVRGMAHRLGSEWSMRVAWGAYASALAMSAVLAVLVEYDMRWYAPTVVFGVGALVASVAAARLRRDAIGLQFGFGTLSLAAVVLAVGWLGAVT